MAGAGHRLAAGRLPLRCVDDHRARRAIPARDFQLAISQERRTTGTDDLRRPPGRSGGCGPRLRARSSSRRMVLEQVHQGVQPTPADEQGAGGEGLGSRPEQDGPGKGRAGRPRGGPGPAVGSTRPRRPGGSRYWVIAPAPPRPVQASRPGRYVAGADRIDAPTRTAAALTMATALMTAIGADEQSMAHGQCRCRIGQQDEEQAPQPRVPQPGGRRDERDDHEVHCQCAEGNPQRSHAATPGRSAAGQ